MIAHPRTHTRIHIGYYIKVKKSGVGFPQALTLTDTPQPLNFNIGRLNA